MQKRQRHLHRLFYLAGILLILGSGFLWWQNAINPSDRENKQTVTFTIQKGEGLKMIAENLREKGLIRNQYAFLLAAKIQGIEGSIQAGTFEISPSMDVFMIASKLTNGTNDVRITIPEGKRAEEIADLLSGHFSTFDKKTWMEKLIEYEGYLFPDTYDFSKEATVGDVIKKMNDNFENKYTTLQPDNGRSKEEIVIIASMVEREARHDEDRQLVAGVITNRLDIGMKLDIDSTVQYALGYDPVNHSWWHKTLSADDLAVDSPYNTYTNAGLPPGPISNPGLAALKAAANPADTNYLYYITDKQGINRYAKTIEEQDKNIELYGLIQ